MSHPTASTRLAARFDALRRAGRCGLIPYIAAGDPTPELTVPLLHTLAAAGADVIELGVPFSDPMADGPVVQRAAERAIANGVGLRRTLELAAAFRRDDPTTPLVLMGYANPIERMGRDAFVAAARSGGVDGVLVVDYPPEEAGDFAAALRGAGIDPIFLLAPTTSEARIAAIGAVASGYLYYVGLTGTTGAGHLDVDAVARRLPSIRERVQVPVGVGFGIKDAASARAIGRFADAVVVGSRLIQEIEAAPRERVLQAVGDFAGSLRSALDDGREAKGKP